MRERAFFYWRLLSLDGFETAKRVIFGSRGGFDSARAVRVVDAVDAFEKFVPKLGHFSSISRQAVRKVVETREQVQDEDDFVLGPVSM